MISPNPSRLPRIVLLLSIVTSLFWCLGQLINVYHFAVVGVIFEILWLPMITLLIGLPIVSLINWVKEKFNPKSLYLYSLIIIVAAVLFMWLRN